MAFFLRTTSLGLKCGTRVEIGAEEVLVVVGPNNSGKSTLLRELLKKLEGTESDTAVIADVEWVVEGSEADLRSWLHENTEYAGSVNKHYFWRGSTKIEEDALTSSFSALGKRGPGRRDLVGLLCRLLQSRERIDVASTGEAFAAATLVPTTPHQVLFKNDAEERRVAAECQRAFGAELVVYRGGGTKIPLYWGTRPRVEDGEDRVSPSYLQKVRRLPLLEEQGDGVRSFVGTLIWTALGSYFLLMIDEPEAFLHPPQARAIGQMLGSMANDRRQVVLATHSSDVLRGLMDDEARLLRIVRLARDGAGATATTLEPKRLRAIWADPLVRYGGVLDGIFHDVTVICEADADCRYFQSVYDSLPSGEGRNPDVLFTYVGGKSAFQKVIPALVEVGVPVRVICDFDTLNDAKLLRGLVESVRGAGAWASIERDWRVLDAAVRSLGGSPPKLRDVEERIGKVLAGAGSEVLTSDAARQIVSAVKLEAGWRAVKTSGRHGLPSGDASSAYARIDAKLREFGIFVIPVGELEGFARSIPDHGPGWLRKLYELYPDVRTSEGYADAERFVRAVAGIRDAGSPSAPVRTVEKPWRRWFRVATGRIRREVVRVPAWLWGILLFALWRYFR